MRVSSPAYIADIKVADEVWIATALLHRERPERPDFTVNEIIARAREERLSESPRKGLYVHAIQHCVANRVPNSGRYRMLTETTPGRRRLFRLGDSYDTRREGSKTVPDQDDIPERYRGLLDWYKQWNLAAAQDRIENDPLLALYGSGKKIWADEPADEYVRRLREGWE